MALLTPCEQSEYYCEPRGRENRCSRCSELKPCSDMQASRPASHEHTATCKGCHREKNAEWRSANRDIIRATDKARRAANPHYYSSWLEKNQGYHAAYYVKNKERRRAQSAAWAKANPEKICNRDHRRRERIKSGLTVTAQDIKRLLMKPCAYCGNSAEHVDHVVPLARGGRHSIGNLAPACAKCNMSKGAKFLTEWRNSRPL